MGILSKIKDLFSRKSIETVKEFEVEFHKLLKKTDSEVIALMGTKGKIKGLPLIYASQEGVKFRKYIAKLAELVAPIQFLYEDKIMKDIIIRYIDSSLYLRPIMPNISFFVISAPQGNLELLQSWIIEHDSIIRNLFHDQPLF
ncbi:MAG: hypothetical protein ACTSRS_01855 [Candidatus Helarchaeota archaeon]